MRTNRTLLMSVVVSAVALSATPAMGAGGSQGGGQAKDRGGAAESTQLPAPVLAALKRDLGMSEEQAKRHGAQQTKAIKLDEALRVSLGDAFAGSSYDAKSGRLVVMVSDAAKLDDAEAAGADARPVKRSKAQLDAIKEELDTAAGKAEGSSAAKRRPNGPRQPSVAGMTSWYVDTQSNTVHVTVQKGRAKEAAAKLGKYGDAVTIEESELDPTQAEFMDGGDLINYSLCSAGFNLRNPSTGQGFLLTAGHCVSNGSTVTGQGGFTFGRVLESWFPTYDDAIVRNDSAGRFVQGPWVDYNPSQGGYITTQSYTDAPVGTTLCKSGITTKWTCGKITVKDETVTMDSVNTVYGLTRHSACVEKGDSGGANVSVTSTYAAEGVSSGASLRSDGTRPRCLSTFGQTNVSWYYPIADSLAHYGPRYGVNIW